VEEQMAKRQPPSIKRPTLEYFAFRGPHRVAVGDLKPAGLPGLVFTPTSGRRLPIIAVAPNTHRSVFSSHQGLALDLSRAMRMVAYGDLGGGRVRGDLRRLGVLGHSTGGGAAMLAAAADDQIRAVVTVTAAETRPSAVQAAGRVQVPSLHLIGSKDGMAEADGARIARACTGPAQLRKVTGTSHLGLTEEKSLLTWVSGQDPDKRVQQVTRMLASAFFIRHLTDAPQLADELENAIRGTSVEDLQDPDLDVPLDKSRIAAAAML
jgi:pimeloyl-ACP methyl ester carboxylesterase